MRPVLALAALVVIAGLAYLLLQERSTQYAERTEKELPDAAPERPPPAEGSPLEARGGQDAEPATGLIVAVVVGESFEPLAEADVAVMETDIRARTNADGLVLLQVPPGRTLRVLADGHRAGATSRIEEVPAVESGIDGRARIELDWTETVRCHFRLVARATGDPVASAKIRIGDPRAGWDEGVDALSDLGGNVVLRRVRRGRHVAHVEAAGFGPALFPLGQASSLDQDPPLLHLDRAAALAVLLRDAAGRARPDLQVRLAAHPTRLAGAQEVFFSGRTWERKGTTGPDGRCRLEDLPPRAALALAVLADGRIVHLEKDALMLEPAEERSVELVIAAGATVTGRLRDERRQAVSNCLLWLVRATSPKKTLLGEHNRPHATTRTGPAGDFRFDDVPSGAWWIGPAPGSGVAPLAESEELQSSDVERRVELIAYRYTIEGRVVDSADSAVADATVFAHLPGGGGGMNTRSDQGGRFVLGPLAPGRYEIGGLGSRKGGHSGSQRLNVEAGARDVEVRLVAGFEISGTVEDARTRSPAPAIIKVVGERLVMQAGRREPVSTFGFTRVPAGEFTVVARTADGRIGVRSLDTTDPRAVEELVPLRVSHGAWLTVHYTGSEKAETIHVAQGNHILELLRLRRRKQIRLLVPPGKVELRRGDEVVASVQLAAGDEKDCTCRGK